MTRKAIPAASFFVGRSLHQHERQPLPIIPFAYQEPIETRVVDTFDWIADDERTECYGGLWSPAQVCRKEQP